MNSQERQEFNSPTDSAAAWEATVPALPATPIAPKSLGIVGEEGLEFDINDFRSEVVEAPQPEPMPIRGGFEVDPEHYDFGLHDEQEITRVNVSSWPISEAASEHKVSAAQTTESDQAKGGVADELAASENESISELETTQTDSESPAPDDRNNTKLSREQEEMLNRLLESVKTDQELTEEALAEQPSEVSEVDDLPELDFTAKIIDPTFEVESLEVEGVEVESAPSDFNEPEFNPGPQLELPVAPSPVAESAASPDLQGSSSASNIEAGSTENSAIPSPSQPSTQSPQESSAASSQDEEDNCIWANPDEVVFIDGNEGYGHIDLACFDVNDVTIDGNRIDVACEDGSVIKIQFTNISHALFANGVEVSLS